MLVDASRGTARNIPERGAAETEDDGGWGDLAKRVRRRVEEKPDDGDQPSAAAAYNYGDGEMEVSEIKKDKWADMEDDEDDDEWIDEMWARTGSRR